MCFIYQFRNIEKVLERCISRGHRSKVKSQVKHVISESTWVLSYTNMYKPNRTPKSLPFLNIECVGQDMHTKEYFGSG